MLREEGRSMKRKRTRRLSKRQRRVLVEATTSDGCHAKLALDIQPPLHSGDRITLSGKVSLDANHSIVRLTSPKPRRTSALPAPLPSSQKNPELWYEERVAH
jgi:hypothetical protein